MDEAAFAPARYKLDVDEYFRIAQAGVFAREHRIELIDGDLIDMASIGQEHEALVGGLTEALFIGCAGRAIVWPQNSVRIDRLNALQPILAIHRAGDQVILALAPKITVKLDLVFG